MKICVPESDTSSTNFLQKFYSFSEFSEVLIELDSMADGEQILNDTPMSDASSRELLAALSQCEIQELLRIRGERIAQSSQNQQTTSSTSNSLGSSFPPSIPAALSVPAKIDANLPK
ncbi:hypothetical protein K3495_g8119 [Podosphaera aphanis]|nr:hypothetical protein K3495_g8119 [Podosphaera aphanis]